VGFVLAESMCNYKATLRYPTNRFCGTEICAICARDAPVDGNAI
jgi:hypothetical protein